MKTIHTSFLTAFTLLACGGGAPARSADSPETAAPTSGTAESPAQSTGDAPATFADQVALGQTLYGEHCAKCHGGGGEGDGAPAVVGLDKGALPLDPPAKAKLRKEQFVTVADVAGFVVKNMPPGAAGSLTEEQYFAILAFDLKANGIDLDKKLDAALAGTLTIPRK